MPIKGRTTPISLLWPGLGRIADQVSADPEDPAECDLFAGLEITFKRIGSLFTDHLLHIFRLIWSYVIDYKHIGLSNDLKRLFSHLLIYFRYKC